jgi:hypothetical protein
MIPADHGGAVRGGKEDKAVFNFQALVSSTNYIMVVTGMRGISQDNMERMRAGRACSAEAAWRACGTYRQGTRRLLGTDNVHQLHKANA